jgi:hypothetical protein
MIPAITTPFIDDFRVDRGHVSCACDSLTSFQGLVIELFFDPSFCFSC